VEQALRTENVELPAGSLESLQRDYTLRLARGYLDPEDFREMVIAQGEDGHLIRLGEVAEVEFGAEEDRSFFHGNGEPQVGLGIIKQSRSNLLEVAEGARAEIADIERGLPQGTSIFYSYDSSVFVEESIKEVYKTLAIALSLVVLVIYVFLGTARATIVPAITVPVSLLASFIVLYIFDYSINMLTLLALVLAIGLVVDDAIVVLENIYRRIQKGEPPLLAAYRGARQVGFAVIATTLVLISVFVPIAFLQGNIGRLFAELAVAVAAAVAFSSLVALTLVPMLGSKILRASDRKRGRVQSFVDVRFKRFAAVYRRFLERAIAMPATVGVGVLGVFAAIGIFVSFIPSELVPQEDRGAFFIRIEGPEGAGFDYTLRQMAKAEEVLFDLIERGEANRVLLRAPASFAAVNNFNGGFGIIVLTDWEARDRSTEEIMADVRRRLGEEMPGARAMMFMRQGIGSSFASRPIQFVVGGPTYDALIGYREVLREAVDRNPGIVNADFDYRETKPQMEVMVNRDRAADLGVPVETVGRTLETMIGSRQVTTFIRNGEEYDVILQGRREDRQNPQDLNNIYVRSDRSGELIPLASLVRLDEFAAAESLNRYNRVRALTMTASLSDGYTLGEALEYLEQVVRTELPAEVQIGYKGESLEFRESGAAIYFSFALALVVVFLVLAAQFESFIHPVVIMTSVPMALLGAVFGLFLFGSTLNIYSQVGIIILVGIAAKNGILIVEFANQLRDAGRSIHDAILEACEIRLRPIVMTGLSTTFGALPLVLASGAGSEARVTIGIVVFSGVLLATALTLIIVPVFYGLLARYTRSPKAVEDELRSMQETQA
ncbi:MAG: efflux RND transporter permease subunit, partial [Alphaproteobacteria bacterium]|nr:efflux RND transporter permease subunit [Alphaproteobacteria bacterium]